MKPTLNQPHKGFPNASERMLRRELHAEMSRAARKGIEGVGFDHVSSVLLGSIVTGIIALVLFGEATNHGRC